MTRQRLTGSYGGEYVLQPQGYEAFVPAVLPPSDSFLAEIMDNELWQLLSAADRAVARLDGSTEALPNPDLFVRMYEITEAVLSSQIEGTQASLLDVLEEQVESNDIEHERKARDDVQEVQNHIQALRYGIERMNSLPISKRLLSEIHLKLLQGVRGGERSPGEFRSVQNWIGPPGTPMEEAAFIPPPPDVVETALDELERFIHADEPPLPLLIKVGIIHACFETVHPFLDGNGRIGRLLITLLLIAEGVIKRPLLYFSHYLRRRRMQYYDSLQRTRDRGDWCGWLKFFLRGVQTVSQESTTTARKVVALREKHRELIVERQEQRAANTLAILESLYSQPLITVRRAAKEASVSVNYANRLVNELVDLGILVNIGGRQRNRRFAYLDYVMVFPHTEL